MKTVYLIVVLFFIILLVLVAPIFCKEKVISNFTTIDADDYTVEEIPNFLSKQECDTIMRISTNKLFQSEVFVKDGDVADANVRISKQCWLKDTDDELIQKISQRIAERTNTEIALQEEMQIVKYDSSGFYKPHYDACDSTTQDYCERMNKGMGPRYITFIMYLNDGFEGGETIFPNIDRKIVPEMGKAAIFYNVNKDGLLLEKSLHGGMNVINGEKWIANKWIHQGN